MNVGKIGRISTEGIIKEFQLPHNDEPFAITTGPDGALWFTQRRSNRIGRITTDGVVSEYDYPRATRGDPGGITTAPDGTIWIGMLGQVGRMVLNTTAVDPPRSGVLSHIAAGAGWTTTITLVNTSSLSLPVTIALYSSDGVPLNIPIKDMVRGTVSVGRASSIIRPNATTVFSAGDQMDAVVVGSCHVMSAAPVRGFAIFRSSVQGGAASEATVPLQTQFANTIILPYDNTDGQLTGIALTNLSPITASIAATVWDQSGNEIGAHTLSIPASGHASFLSDQLLPTATRRGIVKFQSNRTEGISGVALRFSAFGTFTALPSF